MPTEHQHQVALIRWWSLECQKYGVPESLLFAIPNGGARDCITGARLKAEGVRKGIPDLCLAVPNNDFHGLYIEMKTEKGRASKEQKELISILSSMGYRAVICFSWVEARQEITEYLSARG